MTWPNQIIAAHADGPFRSAGAVQAGWLRVPELWTLYRAGSACAQSIRCAMSFDPAGNAVPFKA